MINFFIFIFLHLNGNPLWNSEYMIFPLNLLGFYAVLITTNNSIRFGVNFRFTLFFYFALISILVLQSSLSFALISHSIFFFISLILVALIFTISLRDYKSRIISFSMTLLLFIQPIAWNYSNNVNNLGRLFDKNIVTIQKIVRTTAAQNELTYDWADPSVDIPVFF